MQQKKTLVLGASLKPHCYSYKAAIKLQNYHIHMVAVGLREGSIEELHVGDVVER